MLIWMLANWKTVLAGVAGVSLALLLAVSRAELAGARADLRKADESLTTEKANTAGLKAAINDANRRLELAQKDAERAQALSAQSVVALRKLKTASASVGDAVRDAPKTGDECRDARAIAEAFMKGIGK